MKTPEEKKIIFCASFNYISGIIHDSNHRVLMYLTYKNLYLLDDLGSDSPVSLASTFSFFASFCRR